MNNENPAHPTTHLVTRQAMNGKRAKVRNTIGLQNTTKYATSTKPRTSSARVFHRPPTRHSHPAHHLHTVTHPVTVVTAVVRASVACCRRTASADVALPISDNGGRVSFGSLGHVTSGRICQRCVHHCKRRGICRFGALCFYCHVEHPSSRPRPVRVPLLARLA